MNRQLFPYLKMEAEGSSEMIVINYQTTRCSIPEDNLHSPRRENPNSHAWQGNAVTDLLKALLGNGFVNKFQYATVGGEFPADKCCRCLAML
jgi:hypothetical protein